MIIEFGVKRRKNVKRVYLIYFNKLSWNKTICTSYEHEHQLKFTRLVKNPDNRVYRYTTMFCRLDDCISLLKYIEYNCNAVQLYKFFELLIFKSTIYEHKQLNLFLFL